MVCEIIKHSELMPCAFPKMDILSYGVDKTGFKMILKTV